MLKDQYYCEHCGQLVVKKFGSGRFCSRACANSRTHTQDTIDKISKGVRSYIALKDHKSINNGDGTYTLTCKVCGKKFISKTRRRTCSDTCIKISKGYYNHDLKTLYRRQCGFKFSLSKFKDEFDFDLLKRFGIYKAVNKGNNPDGISRDHMYSVNDGFKNKIDPYILSHPANCQLISQKDNESKHSKSSITLDELLIRIKE